MKSSLGRGGRADRQFAQLVSPQQGELDWMICREMNTSRMGQFLAQVSQAHPDEFLIMVVDGASSHKSKDLVIPGTIRLFSLPACSPELNPQEHVWYELRENESPHRVFERLDAATRQLEHGLNRLANDRNGLRNLTNWPWIDSLILKAN